MTEISQMTFEAAMAELEKVVRDLENGNVSLEDSLRMYERGAALRAHCDAKLKAAEERVEKITLSQSGEPTGTTPVTGL
ncbi:exodeoxyribonuclease VII small subunit [Paracoccus sp. p4-l81]|uniref:exodeoxyribonuclease VII small subunit n=1 Tax=unclassified Paracoccus (in: a-proteobacteria) TaxID=2688777 RepID=UPI0035B87C22